jgi:hypothetical protein
MRYFSTGTETQTLTTGLSMKQAKPKPPAVARPGELEPMRVSTIPAHALLFIINGISKAALSRKIPNRSNNYVDERLRSCQQYGIRNAFVHAEARAVYDALWPMSNPSIQAMHEIRELIKLPWFADLCGHNSTYKLSRRLKLAAEGKLTDRDKLMPHDVWKIWTPYWNFFQAVHQANQFDGTYKWPV